MAETIIALFKEKTGLSEEEWEKICRRYCKRDFTTLTAIISKECNKSHRAVKAELEIELQARNTEKKA